MGGGERKRRIKGKGCIRETEWSLRIEITRVEERRRGRRNKIGRRVETTFAS